MSRAALTDTTRRWETSSASHSSSRVKAIATILLAVLLANAGGFPEISAVVAAAVVVVLAGASAVRWSLRSCIPLLAVLCIAAAVTAFVGEFGWDALRATYVLIRVPIWLGLGLAVMIRFQDVRVPINAIMCAAVGLSIYFIYLYITSPEIVAEGRYALRTELAGGWTLLPLAILAAIYTFFTQERRTVFRVALLGTVIGLSLVAVLLSQSRTALIALAAGGVFMAGWVPVRIYSSIVTPIIFAALFVLTTPVLNLFLSPETVGLLDASAPNFLREILSLNRTNLGDINSFWRGYEAFTVYEFVTRGGSWSVLFGTGLHSLVPLSILHTLGDRVFGDIPVFHSLYSFSIVRAGLLGVVLMGIQYIVWAKALSKFAMVPTRAASLLGRYGLGVHLSALVSVPTTAGFLNGGESGSTHLFVLGMVMGCGALLATRSVEDQSQIST